MDFALIRSFFSTARKQGWNIIDALTHHPSYLAKSLRLALIIQPTWAVTIRDRYVKARLLRVLHPKYPHRPC